MRRRNDPATRLARIQRLRVANAPEWVIKSEQIALALARRGLLHNGIGRRASKAQEALYAKHVAPLLNGEA